MASRAFLISFSLYSSYCGVLRGEQHRRSTVYKDPSLEYMSTRCGLTPFAPKGSGRWAGQPLCAEDESFYNGKAIDDLEGTQAERATCALGEAKRVEGAARVADLLALQRALEAQEAARLRLAAGRSDVLPPLHLHEARQQELHEQQRRYSAAHDFASAFANRRCDHGLFARTRPATETSRHHRWCD